MTTDNSDKTEVMDIDSDELKTIIQSFVAETTLVGEVRVEKDSNYHAAIGEQGQRYQVGNILGAGGMGLVLQAFDRNLERPVAMKVLQRAHVNDGSHALRFIREAEITGVLEHPNIIPLHELGLDKGNNVYYTMKHVQGETLKHVLRQLENGVEDYLRDYPFQRLVGIFLKVCDAMTLAHARGVIHRDLKPENIMIGAFGEVLLIDWGLARKDGDTDIIFDSGEEPLEDILELVTQAGAVMGTPGYMSPEQVRGADVGPLSDIFSLGAILYSILTFKPPVRGANIRELVVKLLKGDITPPEEYWNDRDDGQQPVHLPGATVPLGLSAVAMKALAIHQGNRYQSVAELKQDMESFQAGYATGAEQASLIRQLGLLLWRSRRILAVLSVIIIALISYGGVFTLNLKKEIRIANNRELDADRLSGEAETKRQAAQTVFMNLKSKSPTLEKQARVKLETHDAPGALILIKQAIFLDPENPDFQELMGDILQNLFRFEDAYHFYEKAIQAKGLVPELMAKKDLSLQLATTPDGEFQDALSALNKHMVEHKRYQESLHIIKQIGKVPKLYLVTGKMLIEHLGWDATLKREEDLLYGHGVFAAKKVTCLKVNRCDPYFDFNSIKGLRIGDLRVDGARFLTGWPALASHKYLHRFEIQGAQSVDANTLKNIQVKEFRFKGYELKNVDQLSKLGIQHLYLFGNAAKGLEEDSFPVMRSATLGTGEHEFKNLDFLLKFPDIASLEFKKAKISDLSAFDKLPATHFRRLSFNSCPIDDLSFLRKHTYETFFIPNTNVASMDGIDFSNLTILDISGSQINDLSIFQKREAPRLFDLDVSNCWIHDISPVVDLKLTTLNIRGLPIDDISPIGNMKLIDLNLDNLNITDISALKSMPLISLSLKDTPVSDLTILRNIPLEEVHLEGTAVSDLTPIVSERLRIISFDVDRVDEKSLKALRKCKKLKQINDIPQNQFWQQFDSRKTP